jgi:hypothetical protein
LQEQLDIQLFQCLMTPAMMKLLVMQ